MPRKRNDKFCSCGCGKLLKRYIAPDGSNKGYGAARYAPDCDRKFTEAKQMLIPQTDLAWVAGIIEGEGCIAIANPKISSTGSRRRFLLAIYVDNTDYRIIEKLHTLFGGYVGVSNRKDALQKKKLTQYRWQVSSAKAAAILRLIKPFMVSKIEEACLGINSYEAIKNRQLSPDLENLLTEYRQQIMRLHSERPEPKEDSVFSKKKKGPKKDDPSEAPDVYSEEIDADEPADDKEP